MVLQPAHLQSIEKTTYIMPRENTHPTTWQTADLMDDRLYEDWARAGGGFSVAPSGDPVDSEELITRTAAAAPGDARLFWVAASWLAVHHNLVSTRRLSDRLRAAPPLDLAVAGAMLAVARDAAGSATQLDSALKHC